MTDFLTLAKSEECEAAFYRAFAAADLSLMLNLWDDAPDICCIHPMGLPLLGREAVAAGWGNILSSRAFMAFSLEPIQMHVTGNLAVSLLYERIQVAGEVKTRPPILATNVYRETPAGWRMIPRHASPAVVGMENGASDVPRHPH